MQIIDTDGHVIHIDTEKAREIDEALIIYGYVRKGKLTDKYFNDKKTRAFDFGEELNPLKDEIVRKLDVVFNPELFKPANARKTRVAHFRNDLFKEKFSDLWKRINAQTFYQVNFSTNELIKKSIDAIDRHLKVTEIRIVVSKGSLESIRDKESLETGTAMTAGQIHTIQMNETVGESVKYDLVGKLVESTGLTHKTIVEIMKGIPECDIRIRQSAYFYQLYIN